MVEFRFKVVVDTSSAKAEIEGIGAALQDVEDKGRAVGTSLGGVFAALGVARLAKEAVELADAFATIQNRIRVVNSDTSDLNRTTAELLRISNETRTGLSETVTLYQRLSTSSAAAGRTQEQLIGIISNINKAVALSGSSAQEANAGLLQLAQGLSLGVLRGQDLRSVLEHIPVVADVIAKQLGVTRGALRALGEQGKISAESVLRAFEAAGQSLDQAFGRVVPTVSQSLEKLGNNLLSLFGGTGLSQSVAQVVGNLADLVAFLDRVFRAVSQSNTALSYLITLTGSLGFAIIAASAASAGLVGAIAGIAAAVASATLVVNRLNSELSALFQETNVDEGLSAFGALGKRIQEAQVEAKTLQAILARSPDNDLAKQQLAAITDRIARLRGEQKALSDQARQSNAGLLRGIIEDLQKEASTLGLGNRERRVRAELLKLEKEVTSKGVNLDASAKAELEAVVRNNEKLRERGQLLDQIIGRERKYSEEVALAKELLGQGTITFDQFQRLQFQSISQLDRERQEIEATTSARLGAVEAIRLEAQERERRGGAQLSEAERAAIQTGAARNAQLRATAQLQAELTGTSADLLAQQTALNDLYNAGTISLEQYANQTARLEQEARRADVSLSGGLARGLAQIKQEVTDVGAVLETTLVNAFHSTEDALVGFVRTGKISFRDLANSILDDVARLLIRLAELYILETLTGLGPAAGAGISLAGARAGGGPVVAGSSYLVGERGPELFTPAQSGGITTATKTAEVLRGGSSQPTPPPNVNIKVVNVHDPDEIGDEIESGAYDRQIINVARRRRNEIKGVL